MSVLVLQDRRYFEQRLQHRREQLRQLIHDGLAQSQRQDYVKLAGSVHDSGEESVAELLMTMNATFLERETEEMREVEAGLKRIKEDTYGVCVDCGEDITRQRLEAYPTAKRCIQCQARIENSRRGGIDPTPSL